MIISTMTMKPMPPNVAEAKLAKGRQRSQLQLPFISRYIRTIDSLLRKRSRPLHGLTMVTC